MRDSGSVKLYCAFFVGWAGSTLNFVFGDLLIIAFCKEEGHRRRCGNNGKAEEVFARAFPKSWRKSSKKKSLKVLCSKKKKAPGCCLEPKTRVINRLCSGANHGHPLVQAT